MTAHLMMTSWLLVETLEDQSENSSVVGNHNKRREKENLMKTTKKIIIAIITVYLIASCIFSICYHYSDDPWNFKQNRNGLLCMEFSERDFVIYSPFCNHGDVFLFGIAKDEYGWHMFSDGFYEFGEWKID